MAFIMLVDLHGSETDPQFHKLEDLIVIVTPRVGSFLRTELIVTKLMRQMYKAVTSHLLVLLIVEMYVALECINFKSRRYS